MINPISEPCVSKPNKGVGNIKPKPQIISIKNIHLAMNANTFLLLPLILIILHLNYLPVVLSPYPSSIVFSTSLASPDYSTISKFSTTKTLTHLNTSLNSFIFFLSFLLAIFANSLCASNFSTCLRISLASLYSSFARSFIFS